MKPKFKFFLFILGISLLSGCQSMVYGTASDLSRLSLGMTKLEVVQIMGSPISVGADADKQEEYLVYKRMKHVISGWPRYYMVTLRNGKVIKYGEQYEEKNVNNIR